MTARSMEHTPADSALPRSGILDPTIRIVRNYPHAPTKVWRALTDPALVARWMMRPDGFAPTVGNRFRLMAKPQPGWRGFVECEVLEVSEPVLLRYSWVGSAGQKPMTISYHLEQTAEGTRLTFEHSGFAGVSGFLLAKTMLGPGWRKMFGTLLPTLLADMTPQGDLVAGSTLSPRF